jgi:hypothetical protein
LTIHKNCSILMIGNSITGKNTMKRALLTTGVAAVCPLVLLVAMMILPGTGLSLMIFQLLAGGAGIYGTLSAGAIGTAAVVDATEDENHPLAYLVMGGAVLATVFNIVTIANPTGHFLERQLASKVTITAGPIPNSSPRTIEDMPEGTANRLWGDSPISKTEGMKSSELIPAYGANGAVFYGKQYYPFTLDDKLSGGRKVQHLLIQDSGVTEIFSTTSSTFAGFNGTDMKYQLQKARPQSEFSWSDQKYIQLKDGWKLAIPYSDLKWEGLRNYYVYSGVVLIDAKGFEFVSRDESRPDLEIFPIATSNHINSMIAGYNNRNSPGPYQQMFRSYVRFEPVALTTFSNVEDNFITGGNSGFYQGIEPKGASNELSEAIRISGFSAKDITVYKTPGSTTPDVLLGDLEASFIQKYNAVFKVNFTKDTFDFGGWYQIIIDGKMHYYSYLVNQGGDKSKYRGIVFVNSQGEKLANGSQGLKLDNQNSVMFIAFPEDGSFSAKLQDYVEGKQVKSDFLVGPGVQFNQASSQPNAQGAVVTDPTVSARLTALEQKIDLLLKANKSLEELIKKQQKP